MAEKSGAIGHRPSLLWEQSLPAGGHRWSTGETPKLYKPVNPLHAIFCIRQLCKTKISSSCGIQSTSSTSTVSKACLRNGAATIYDTATSSQTSVPSPPLCLRAVRPGVFLRQGAPSRHFARRSPTHPRQHVVLEDPGRVWREYAARLPPQGACTNPPLG